MRVGFLQTFPLFGKKDENLDNAVAGIKRTDADLVVLPELFNTGYQFTSRKEVFGLAETIPEGQTTQALIKLSKEKHRYIVAGLSEREGNYSYNSAILVGPSGFIGCYRKLHLFHHEKLWFEPGNGALNIYDIGQARIGIMICFDWFFPEVARSLALKGADIICHPANLVLPYCPQAMITRCVENRVFAITANRIGAEKRSEEMLTFIGSSQILGIKGEILYRASSDREESMVVEINPKNARDKQITPANHLFHDRRVEFL
ncbi:MAG: acyltransferase [Candidatus Jettenia sp.]|uniref:Hydrolase n=1 Tax=Candidatus Jettenia caeni TaxID=247490 RepID=I3IM16_9BACT|nr:MAG: acyltransferase [Candidatus Jettenia sp. AMX1]MBC6928163.1 acyltransferase [Candidatus Jettenia sp.]WKZ14508.1 MAG: nitrilase-related carbon-nitrogen hydrolase [Candidatus Jettenia caeni]MCE7879255.1 acyltransferase [Candidatus Jettenia sp. AMX1]MCQ3925928.1 acyltransferase [Candidatus Jettenia sp.]